MKTEYVVIQKGIASPTGGTDYFGFFTNQKEIKKFIKHAVKTCMNNDDVGANKEEYAECYKIVEKNSLGEYELKDVQSY